MKLKPCFNPLCKGTDITIEEDSGRYQVWCFSCKSAGKQTNNRSTSIYSWNSIHRQSDIELLTVKIERLEAALRDIAKEIQLELAVSDIEYLAYDYGGQGCFLTGNPATIEVYKDVMGR